ncbi:MAG: glycoside hydrolase domain-containing protein, partial [Bacteroidota bacterium]
MKISRLFSFFILLLIAFSFFTCQHRDKQMAIAINSTTNQPVDLVYPQLDTENSRWFLFSSASRPFGMVNLSPDTKLKGTWGSGYRYEIDTVKGFSHIHGWQLSGLSVMPLSTNDEQGKSIYTDFYSKFSHDTEKIGPGYHFLHLDRHDIDVELTGTERVGFHRYKFQNGTKQEILFLLNATLGPCTTAEGELRQETPTKLSGSFIMQPTERRPKPFKVYFKVALNTEITAVDRDESTRNYKLSLQEINTPVLMKVAISYTSLANAEKNMEAELPHWNFNQVVEESKNHWNEMLSRIKVKGGSETDQRRFYTDLWHALLGRKMINDVSGTYPDNTAETFRIGQLPLTKDGRPQFNHYNSDAFWGAQWTINTLWG